MITEVNFSQFKFLKKLYICYCVLLGREIVFVEKSKEQVIGQ